MFHASSKQKAKTFCQNTKKIYKLDLFKPNNIWKTRFPVHKFSTHDAPGEVKLSSTIVATTITMAMITQEHLIHLDITTPSTHLSNIRNPFPTLSLFTYTKYIIYISLDHRSTPSINFGIKTIVDKMTSQVTDTIGSKALRPSNQSDVASHCGKQQRSISFISISNCDRFVLNNYLFYI